ncbi:hypothetical protein NLJ89_g3120 [Agrocybe chaxingu]|uniref:ABC transporter domain-containing protein n=1 Tax=Agrocybe chaxingu TaxID=84603 RepID=A0A9W8K321_9AGAR|nr:hypothetical protein NLJ89_g3120 [Agrocybe chaxingu]
MTQNGTVSAASEKAENAPTEKEKEKEKKRDDINIEEMQFGVWTFKVASSAKSALEVYRSEIKMAYPLFLRLFTDIYSVSPTLFIVFLACKLWDGIEEALVMHLSSSLLRKIEAGVISGVPDVRGIVTSVMLQLVCSAVVSYMSWHSQRALQELETEVRRYFELHLMKAKLSKDLPTSQEASSSSDISAFQAWRAFADVISFFTEMFKTASQLALIVHLSRESGGPLFALLCIIKPIFSAMTFRAWWDKVCFGFASNEDYRRMMSLENLANGGFRQDIISHNLGAWIIQEYQKARKALSGISDESFYSVYSRRETPTYDVIAKVLGELPVAYCALAMIFKPLAFSVASISILQQSALTLRYSLETILSSTEDFRGGVHSIRRMYEATEIMNLMKDGHLPYPQIDDNEEWNGERGMSFELKDITFAYPGSEKTTMALNGISINIKAGQLVVIVGANGSGKSTLIRILSRLYDSTSGSILIDGHPSKDYHVEDLHRATAILSQESDIYPLTLAENIGLGCPERSNDMALIEEAARDGGAAEFMSKLKDGVQTTLNSYHSYFHNNLHGNRDHPLYEEMEKMKKKIDISGGERQRIVAARSFMRFKSGRVKFVAVDEPSSALDAEGELQLFNRLLDVRKGKTMVFVTHRFGHLTKHADLLICMKDGLIAESGTHQELMERKGEYAKLYDIQAKAFIE